jgi:hypothetical protein
MCQFCCCACICVHTQRGFGVCLQCVCWGRVAHLLLSARSACICCSRWLGEVHARVFAAGLPVHLLDATLALSLLMQLACAIIIRLSALRTLPGLVAESSDHGTQLAVSWVVGRLSELHTVCCVGAVAASPWVMMSPSSTVLCLQRLCVCVRVSVHNIAVLLFSSGGHAAVILTVCRRSSSSSFGISLQDCCCCCYCIVRLLCTEC